MARIAAEQGRRDEAPVSRTSGSRVTADQMSPSGSVVRKYPARPAPPNQGREAIRPRPAQGLGNTPDQRIDCDGRGRGADRHAALTTTCHLLKADLAHPKSSARLPIRSGENRKVGTKGV